MADYYPLLSRAVRNLPRNNSEGRQAIFLRARDALERQLRSVTPQLTDADIIRELLSLEDVIKRIEREMEEEDRAVEASLLQVEEAAGKVVDDTARGEADAPASALPRTEPPAAEPPPIIVPGMRPRIGSASPVDAVPRPNLSHPPEPVAAVAPPEQPLAVEQVETASSSRIRLPTEEDAAKHRRKLRIFGIAGIVAIMGMATLALVMRDRPERYRPGQPDAPPVASVQDPSKSEGRLATGEPSPPAQSPPSPGQAAPEPPPQRQVTSVPIQAPVNQQAPAPEQPPLPIISRAFMILEVPNRPPNQYEGQANWIFAPDPTSRSPEKGLLTSVDFPAAGIKIDISTMRATDASLNASHVVTLAFTPNEGLPGVREMSAVEWREREGQPGTTLAGTLVPIQDNLFMIGLDATEAGRARNLELLRTQRWMVFEIRLADLRRGAFLIEKGSSGEKAIAEALATWR